MKLRSMRLSVAAAVMVMLWLAGGAVPKARAQAQGQAKSQKAEDTFKNVQVLKGISVDDFMGTMGIMSAAVGFDCSECHIGAGTDKVDWAADSQKKIVARKMVTMVTAINRDNFGGRQMVTCWSCHHGRDKPSTTPALEVVYGAGSTEMDDNLSQMPGEPEATQIIDKYLNAIGGAQKLTAIKSYIAKGSSVGFGGFGGGADVTIYAKFPDQRTTDIEFKKETGRPSSVRAYDGHLGWIKTPLAVLTDYQLTGAELDGARVDAQLAFPAQIKTALTRLVVSLPTSISDLPGPSSQTSKESGEGLGKDRVVNVVQGTSPGGTLVTMYFDQQSGLLLRLLRYGKTPIGRIPTQVDYSDYRDVGGIKMPFHLTFAWLDGRDAIQLSDVKTNVQVDEKWFGRPTPTPTAAR
jgi:photosynthetic reaction center cytochrome c subunit